MLASEPGWTIKKDGAGGPYAYKDTAWVGFDDYGYVSKKVKLSCVKQHAVSCVSEITFCYGQ